MMKKIFVLLWVLLLSFAAHGQTQAIQGFCSVGGEKVSTSGLPSTTMVQASFPRCQVEVFLTGTTTLATIFADANNTPLSNPFTANINASWLFYAATGTGYDITMSGGIPIPFPSPFTLVDVIEGGGGGGGASPVPPEFSPQLAAPGFASFITDPDLIVNTSTHTLNELNININSTLTQTCTNPLLQAESGGFACQSIVGTNSLVQNVGQDSSGSNALQETYNITSPGTNPGTNGAINSFDETGGGGPVFLSNITQRGNHQGGSFTLNSFGIGDAQGGNVAVLSPCNPTQGSDESCEGLRIDVSQISLTTTGTITSGGTTGSTDLQTTVTSGNSAFYTDQAYLFDRSKPTGTAVITAQALNTGLNSVVQTVSGISLTPSTAWGQMQQSSVTYAPVGGAPVGLYQNLTSTTATIVLGTSPASPGAFTTGAMTCSGSALEYMQVTAVSAVTSGQQTVTFLTRNGWDNRFDTTTNAACFQGGSLAGQAFLASSALSNFTIAYPVVGVISATQFVSANCSGGFCNTAFNNLDLGTPITFFPMAEVIGTNLGTPGAAQLGFNNAPWVNGDTVISALPETAAVSGIHLNMQHSTPQPQQSVNTPIAPQSYGYGVFDIGPTPTTIDFYGEAGFSTSNNSFALVAGAGSYQNGFILSNAPPSGGCLICTVGSNAEGSSITGSVSGTQLTVSAIASGLIKPSQDLVGPGIPSGCLIQQWNPGAGTRGGVGTYTLTCSASVSSEAMTTTRGLYFITASLGTAGPSWSYDVTTDQSVIAVNNGNGGLTLAAEVFVNQLLYTPFPSSSGTENFGWQNFNNVLLASDGATGDISGTVGAQEFGAATFQVGAVSPTITAIGGNPTGTQSVSYMVTGLTVNGETPPSAEVTCTNCTSPPTPSAQNDIFIANSFSENSFNVYRWAGTGSNTDPTQYGLVTCAIKSSTACGDEGTIAAGTHPPSTNTTPKLFVGSSQALTGVQGTDAKIMTAGTVSGTGATLCTDSGGGATTVGCTTGSVGTPTVTVSANIGTGAVATLISGDIIGGQVSVTTGGSGITPTSGIMFTLNFPAPFANNLACTANDNGLSGLTRVTTGTPGSAPFSTVNIGYFGTLATVATTVVSYSCHGD
jgi:hypothetical protein